MDRSYLSGSTDIRRLQVSTHQYPPHMKIKGPFNINIPTLATRISLHNLTQEQQQQLLGDEQLELEQHDLYEVGIVPEIRMLEGNRIPRIMKKRSYHKVDRVLIHADLSHTNGISLIGILPTTETVRGQRHLDIDEVEASIFDKIKFKVKGAFKNIVRKSTHNIFAQKNRSFAQWIFLDNYIQNVADYTLRLFFTAAPSVAADERYVTLDVDFQRGGESLNRARDRVVSLSA